MNKDILIDAMSMIPDDLLMEADAYQGETPKYYIPRKPGFIKRYKKLIISR